MSQIESLLQRKQQEDRSCRSYIPPASTFAPSAGDVLLIFDLGLEQAVKAAPKSSEVLRNRPSRDHVKIHLAHSAKSIGWSRFVLRLETTAETSLTTVVSFQHIPLVNHIRQHAFRACAKVRPRRRHQQGPRTFPHSTIPRLYTIPVACHNSTAHSFSPPKLHRTHEEKTKITHLYQTDANNPHRRSPRSSPPPASPAPRATSASAPRSSATLSVRSPVSPPTSAASSNCSETPRTSARGSWPRREYVVSSPFSRSLTTRWLSKCEEKEMELRREKASRVLRWNLLAM